MYLCTLYFHWNCLGPSVNWNRFWRSLGCEYNLLPLQVPLIKLLCLNRLNWQTPPDTHINIYTLLLSIFTLWNHIQHEHWGIIYSNYPAVTAVLPMAPVMQPLLHHYPADGSLKIDTYHPSVWARVGCVPRESVRRSKAADAWRGRARSASALSHGNCRWALALRCAHWTDKLVSTSSCHSETQTVRTLFPCPCALILIITDLKQVQQKFRR